MGFVAGNLQAASFHAWRICRQIWIIREAVSFENDFFFDKPRFITSLRPFMLEVHSNGAPILVITQRPEINLPQLPIDVIVLADDIDRERWILMDQVRNRDRASAVA